MSRWAIRSRIGRPIVPASISARSARYQGRNRQFSWIISRTPAASQASIIASRSGRTGRRRLLAEDVRPVPGGQLDQLAVRLGPGADLDEVERLLVLEQRRGVGVAAGPRAPRPPARSRRSGIEVAEGDEPGLRDPRPGLQVVLRDEPAADQGPLKRRRGAPHGESRRQRIDEPSETTGRDDLSSRIGPAPVRRHAPARQILELSRTPDRRESMRSDR